MQVQKINSTYPQKNNIGFKNWERVVYNPSKICSSGNKIQHRNTTWILRPSAKYWQDLVLFLNLQFKDISKVNTYVYGCSDGSDAYSFLFALESVLKPKVIQKFLPIIAKDYDPKAIEKCLERKIALNETETGNIKELINHNKPLGQNDFDRYFEFVSYNDGDITIVKGDNGYEYWTNDFIYRIKDPLFKKVNFQQADITKDYINIEPENSLVFARNFWPYLKEYESITLARNLYNKLENNSILILGNYDTIRNDYGKNASDILLDTGFKKSPIKDCFIK